MAAVGHFGCPKFTLDHISGQFRSIQIYLFFLKFLTNENHFRSHFYPFHIDMQLFFLKFLTKWLPSAILDVRNSLSIAFLAISDRSAILDFLNSLSIAILAISDRYRIFFLIFDKMAAGGHFGCPQITFDRISGHFRSIFNFFFVFFF